MGSRTFARLGRLHHEVDAALRRLDESRAVDRLWRRDGTLWSSDPAVARAVEDRLGWLEAPAGARARLATIVEARARFGRGARRVILLGMGGSSLAPEVMARVLPRDGPPFTVLDSTAPDAVREVEAEGIDDTVFVVSSKSGTTVETRVLAAYFLDRARGARGATFLGITDPSTPLAGQSPPLSEVFLNPPDIGGRYSALSSFGLAPAAIIGADVGRLLDETLPMVEACRNPDPGANPGAWLGAVLAAGAQAGRDKVTCVLSPGLGALGAWIEQLLAESTGKEGRGVLPVDGELLSLPDHYGDDRLFVRIALADETDQATEDALDRLVAAGHPVAGIVVDGPYDLGAEFFRWEVATALGGFLMGINPFDEPNVQQAKDQTNRLLGEYRRTGRLPEDPGDRGAAARTGRSAVTLVGVGQDSGVEEELERFLGEASPPGYVAFLAYVPRTPANAYALAGMRRSVRDVRRVATIRGFGPRYLHSSGQYFKGGPNTGTFVVFTADTARDLAIPGETYTFGTLLRAQALGDILAMRASGRRVLHAHLSDPSEGLQTATGLIHRRFPGTFDSGEIVGVPPS